MKADPVLITNAVTIVAGVGGQILARRLRVPAILPLLALGIVLGPDLLGVVQPMSLGADGLRMIVGFGVAIILFEGGLSLKTESFRLAGKAIRNLVLFGSLLTWGLCALFAHLFFPDLDVGLTVLFGALVIVTGPTVILPLLHAVRPRKRVGDVLRGEAILIDPVGALYAVLVLEFLIEAESGGSGYVFLAFGGRILLGILLGALGAGILHMAIRHERVLAADLRNLAVVAVAIGLYALSETIVGESGVLTVTVAGFLLGWLRPPGLEEIEEFKGHLTVLMVSVVFVLLSANLRLEGLWELGWPGVGVVLAIIFVVRPVTVFLSTIGTDLMPREKLFLSWIAPRGIVAASVSSLFALLLERAGVPGGTVVMNLTFAVIVGTVFLQGPTARPVARLLNVLEEARTGFLVIGSNSVGLALGRALDRAGLQVVLVDTNPWRVIEARKQGLKARRGNALDELVMEQLDLDGIGNMVAVTPSDDVNRLAVRIYAREFGADHVRAMRLASSPELDPKGGGPRYLFDQRLAWEDLAARIEGGQTVRSAEVDHELAVGEVGSLLEGAVALLALDTKRQPRFLNDDGRLVIGEVLFYLAPPQEAEQGAPEAA